MEEFYAGNPCVGRPGSVHFFIHQNPSDPYEADLQAPAQHGLRIYLFLLNLLSGITGIVFELNFITAAIVGFLGLPGIVLLLVVQYLL